MSTIEQQQPEPSLPPIVEGAPKVSVVIPCLNEEATIERCVSSALAVLRENGITGEIIVADNDSEDDSARLAAAAGALVVHEPERGYGSAYLAGFAVARGRYILMADADLTYDFEEIPRFVAELDDGADMVIGNRMKNIHPGAMPWLHRYIGNPLLSGFLNLLFRTGVDDAHCGMRAFRRDVLPQLDLRTTGMEFASEMVIRAAKEQLGLRQFPIEYHPREGESKLSSFRDGWRHLRFLLVHSPNHLFIFPGAADGGARGGRWSSSSSPISGSSAAPGTSTRSSPERCWPSSAPRSWRLGICAHAYATYFMGERDRWFDRMRARFTLEHGLMLGGGIMLRRRGRSARSS